VALQLVVVHDDLRVERGHGAVGGGDERIDLHERRTDGVERRVQPLHDVRGRARLGHLAVQLQRKA
jgi:hypothetical protein